MPFLHNCPDFWGQWNHASLTSIAKKNAEIKVGIRKGFAFKGLFAKKNFTLAKVKRDAEFREPGTIGVLLGNLISWQWLKCQIYPRHLKFLHPYYFTHPRALGKSFSNFLWEEMVHLGLWTLKQGDVTVCYKKTKMRFWWKSVDGHAYGRAKRLEGTGKLQLEIFGTKCIIYPEPQEEFEENYYKIKVFENSIHYSTNLTATKDLIDNIIDEPTPIPSSEGDVKEVVECILTIIGVNSMKTPDRGWLTSLMRRMGVLLNGWNIYQWDNSFIGMMSTLYYPELAKGNIEALCAELTTRGFIPNQAHPRGRAEGITQNPVTSYCALKVNSVLGISMANCIPALEANNNWWKKNRDPNGFHLLSYGSELKKKCTAALRQTAQYESGMDNHAMFHKVPVDYESGCMAMYPVFINSIYALDCWSLSKLAKMHGYENLARRMSIRYENMKRTINKHLWDGEIYRNRYWNGEFQNYLYPSYFFPLIAGIPTPEQAEATVKKVFKKCLSPFGLAPSTLDNPFFKQQLLWRGRILPPYQFLASESLRRYEFDLEASALARRCYQTFYKEWSEESHTHESYNGYTGEGDDTSISTEPCHPWACLLPYLSIQDMIDYEVWNDGIRFGRLNPLNAAVNNIPIQGKTYSVRISDDGQWIQCNGNNLIQASYPTILRNFTQQNDSISFTQKALKSIDLNIYINPGNYLVIINDEKFQEHTSSDGNILISLSKLTNSVQITRI
ncbi:MAG: MGH1-like glycoside hydrolase domain-containing protein [Promethearchaeota archaeon]